MAIEEAMRSGAMALFGESTRESARAFHSRRRRNFFAKLCGGTHVRATGDIGVSKSPATNRSLPGRAAFAQ